MNTNKLPKSAPSIFEWLSERRKTFFFSHINITQFKCSQFTIVFCQHLWEKKRVIKSQWVSHRRWPLDPPKHAFKMLTVIQQSFLFFGCTRMVAVSKWTTSACCFPSGRVCPDLTLGEPSDQTCTHTCTDVPLNSINNELPLSCLPLISPPAPAFSFCLLFMTRLLRIHSIYGFSYAVWRNSITHLICLAKRFLPPGSRSDASRHPLNV